MATEVVALSKAKARKLTEAIRESVEETWRLLSEAHDGRAWEALGYDSWEDYVRTEFAMSRSHSYRLLDQARVIREIEAATGVVVPVSTVDARRIKPRLAEVVEEAFEAAHGHRREARQRAVAEVVEEAVANDTDAKPQVSVSPKGDTRPSASSSYDPRVSELLVLPGAWRALPIATVKRLHSAAAATLGIETEPRGRPKAKSDGHGRSAPVALDRREVTPRFKKGMA